MAALRLRALRMPGGRGVPKSRHGPVQHFVVSHLPGIEKRARQCLAMPVFARARTLLIVAATHSGRSQFLQRRTLLLSERRTRILPGSSCGIAHGCGWAAATLRWCGCNTWSVSFLASLPEMSLDDQRP